MRVNDDGNGAYRIEINKSLTYLLLAVLPLMGGVVGFFSSLTISNYRLAQVESAVIQIERKIDKLNENISEYNKQLGMLEQKVEIYHEGGK